MVREKRRPSAMENMDNYKRIFGYIPPYPTICEPEFVKHVQDKNKGETVFDVLKDLLGAQVHIFSTRCISLAIKGLYGEPGHHRADLKECDHTYEDPDVGGITCFKLFARTYPSNQLVVCTMRDRQLHAKYPGRIVVTPDSDSRGGITIFSVADSCTNKSPPPEIWIMNDYKRWFGYKPPFPTICEPEFVHYLRNMGKSESSALEDLLGGSVDLMTTPCINQGTRGDFGGYSDATLNQCEHTGQNVDGALCMRNFVRRYPSRLLVVCTMTARNHYAKVPGRIVITPDGFGGIMIDTVPSETICQHVTWFLRVKRYQLHVFERLRKAILAPKSGGPSIHSRTKEPALKLIVVAKDGEEADNSYFSSVEDAAKKILEISSSSVEPSTASGAMDIVDTDDSEEDVSMKLHLSTPIQDDDEPVKIVVEKPGEITFPTPNKKGKRKRELGESNKSAKVKKSPCDMLDVSPRRPEVDVVERNGSGVTAEAQRLFDALSKTLPVRWDKTVIVVMDGVRVSSPYRAENVAGGTQADNERVRKVVIKHERRLVADQ